MNLGILFYIFVAVSFVNKSQSGILNERVDKVVKMPLNFLNNFSWFIIMKSGKFNFARWISTRDSSCGN